MMNNNSMPSLHFHAFSRSDKRTCVDRFLLLWWTAF